MMYDQTSHRKAKTMKLKNIKSNVTDNFRMDYDNCDVNFYSLMTHLLQVMMHKVLSRLLQSTAKRQLNTSINTGDVQPRLLFKNISMKYLILIL